MDFEMTINFGFGESIEISTDSFWKLAMLNEFVRFVDEVEDEDVEVYEFDEDGVAYWLDQENEVWYWYDEESDDWYECEEEEKEEEEEECVE
jgi:hypothetical protein